MEHCWGMKMQQTTSGVTVSTLRGGERWTGSHVWSRPASVSYRKPALPSPCFPCSSQKHRPPGGQPAELGFGGGHIHALSLFPPKQILFKCWIIAMLQATRAPQLLCVQTMPTATMKGRNTPMLWHLFTETRYRKNWCLLKVNHRKEQSNGPWFIIHVNLPRQVYLAQMFPANRTTGSGFSLSKGKTPPEWSRC